MKGNPGNMSMCVANEVLQLRLKAQGCMHLTQHQYLSLPNDIMTSISVNMRNYNTMGSFVHKSILNL